MEKIGIFTPTKLHVLINVEKIVTLHYFKYAKDFLFGGEKHDFWEMAYVDRGEVGVVAESNGFDLAQGEAIFHKPGEYHNIWAKGKYANAVIVSFVCHSKAMDFFRGKIITFNDEHKFLLGKILAVGELAFVEPLNILHQTQLTKDPHAPPGCDQLIKNYLELLLLRLCQSDADVVRQERLSLTAKAYNEQHIVDIVKHFLGEHLCDNITFDDILKEICFSKSYITRLFREKTGRSLMEYYLELKITESQRLISERVLSFTEIADKLGFSSIHYFSRIFKHKTGMSPTEYKHSVQSSSVL